jgi:hypothetical protein
MNMKNKWGKAKYCFALGDASLTQAATPFAPTLNNYFFFAAAVAAAFFPLTGTTTCCVSTSAIALVYLFGVLIAL